MVQQYQTMSGTKTTQNRTHNQIQLKLAHYEGIFETKRTDAEHLMFVDARTLDDTGLQTGPDAKAILFHLVTTHGVDQCEQNRACLRGR